MVEKIRDMLEEIIPVVVGLWNRITGGGYELQEGKERIYDPRRVVLANQLRRRVPRSGHDCRY